MLLLLMILGFIAWWPLGLLVLAFMIGTGRMAYAWDAGIITATTSAGTTA